MICSPSVPLLPSLGQSQSWPKVQKRNKIDPVGFNYALRGDKAVYWVSTGQQWKVLSQALPESPKPPPLTPIRATWSYFSEVKIQDLKVTCGEGREIY